MWLPHYFLIAAASGTEPAASLGVSGAEIFSIVFSGLDLGVAGLMLLLFIQGKLHSSDEIDHEREARKKAEDQRDEALDFIRDRLAPLVESFTASTGSLLPILQALVSRLELTSREDGRDRDSRHQRR